VCRKGKCVKTAVTDYGPSCFVEKDAKGPVLDASPKVCESLTGGSSCGWSDHFSITVARTVGPEEDGRPYGPFNVTDVELAALVEQGRLLDDQAARAASGEATTPANATSTTAVEPSPSQQQLVQSAEDVLETFDPSAAIEWSNKHCDGSGKECPCGHGIGTGCEPFVLGKSCQCTEFAAHALCHGGLFKQCASELNTEGCPDTSHHMWDNCKGSNLRLGSSLHSKLKNKKGWKEVSATHATKGSVVFYTVNGEAYAHQCLYIGGGKVNCHNNNRCAVDMHLYPFTSILAPP